MSSNPTSSIPLTPTSTSISTSISTSTFGTPLHSGWLQYHIHASTSASSTANLSQLDGSTLPQYYFTLSSTHLSYSLNPSTALSSSPLASIALLPSTALKLVSPPTVAPGSSMTAAYDSLHYAFSLTECSGEEGGAGQWVHVLSAATRADMEQWLTTLRRALFSIKRHNNNNTAAAQQQPRSTPLSLPVSSPARLPATATTNLLSTRQPPTISAPYPLLISTPSSFPSSLSLSPPSPSPLRQRLLSAAHSSPTSVTAGGGSDAGGGGGGGGGGNGGVDVRYVRSSEWSEHTTSASRKICCIIC